MYPDFEEVKGRLMNEGVLNIMKASRYIVIPEKLVAKRRGEIAKRNASKKNSKKKNSWIKKN